VTATGDDPVVIGRIGRPHGVVGELRVIPTGETLASIQPGETLAVAAPGALARAMTVEAARVVARGVLMRLRGVSTREEAAALTGATVSVPAERLSALSEPDEFYVRDLVGCAVFCGPDHIGAVIDVYSGAANDALVVQDGAGPQILVPFTRDALVELDVQGRVVRIRPDLFGADTA